MYRCKFFRLNFQSRQTVRALVVISLILLVLGFSARPAASKKGADETLDVQIRFIASWDDVGKLGNVNIWKSGRASFVIGGRMKLQERDGDTLSYVSESLRATWNWHQVYSVAPKVKGKDACPSESILSVETGKGSSEIGGNDIALQVLVGQSAGMAALVYGGSPNTDGVYVLMVKKMITTTIEQRQKECFPAPYPSHTSGKQIFVLHAQGAMKNGRIRGVHQWNQEERVSFSSPQAQILDYGASPILSDNVPGGNVQIQVSYRAGKPKALQIQRRDGDAWSDVTYEEGDFPWDVITGERVELRAVLLPQEKEASDGKWTIPGRVVEDWVVKGAPNGFGKATVDPLEPPERKGGSVGFHWWGESGERTISVRTSMGGSKQVKARFRVEEPETRIRMVVPSQAQFQVLRMKDSANEELVCVVEGEHTITFRHEPLPWTTPGKTQYVQLVKTDARTEMGTSSTVGSCMELQIEGLDTKYPYAPGPRATDNPGVPATTYDLRISALHDFEMFLLFRPDTDGAIWVPLRIVPWTWNGQAQRATEGAPWDCSASSITRNPIDAEADRFPVWTMVVPENLHWLPCTN